MDLAKKICIVDDDIGSCELTKGFCEQYGFGSQVFLSSQEAIKFLEQFDNKNKNPFSLIICDLKMPEIDGIEFINRLNYLDQKPPVILLTAHGSVDTAIECLNSGAADYLTKPVNFNELLIICNRAIKIHEMEEDYTLLKKELYKTYLLEDMVGKSTQIKNVFEFIQKVSKVSCNVLITGESGTGKEMVARAIHNQQFKSNSGIPFVAINCSSIPETLLESELFGHAKGSFTGATNCRRGLLEDANGGTVFLDEIGELPVYLQAKLLRFLQERKIKPVGDNTYKYLDVRIIAATNMNLKEATKVGTFREDLYFRMCVAPIEIPPLRHRKDDIILLAEHFLKKYTQKFNVKILGFSRTAIAKLLKLDWPGNVRELENTVERAVVFCDEKFINEKDIQVPDLNKGNADIVKLFSSLKPLEEIEKEYIEYVLLCTGHKKEKAADILKINRKTLYRKQHEYEIFKQNH